MGTEARQTIQATPVESKLVEKQIKQTQELSLPEIVSEVKALEGKDIANAIRKGEVLTVARANHFRRKDEGFLQWLAQNFEMTDQTARNLIRLYEYANKNDANSKRVLNSKNLTAAYVVAGAISRPVKDEAPPPLKTGSGKSGTKKEGQNAKIPTPKIVWRKSSGAAYAVVLNDADPMLQIGRLFASPEFQKALDVGLVLVRKGGAA